MTGHKVEALEAKWALVFNTELSTWLRSRLIADCSRLRNFILSPLSRCRGTQRRDDQQPSDQNDDSIQTQDTTTQSDQDPAKFVLDDPPQTTNNIHSGVGFQNQAHPGEGFQNQVAAEQNRL